MPHTLVRPRLLAMTAVAVVLALLATLVPMAPSAARADGGMEAQFVAAVNRERAAQGLPALSTSGELAAVARSWSATMADQSKLYHNPSLGSQVSEWRKVGENVGRGPSVSAIHAALMNSPGHRRNILDAEWTQIGVGVVVRDGTVWVTQVFRTPTGSTSSPAAPADDKPSAPSSSSSSPSSSSSSSSSTSSGSSSGGSSSSSGGSASLSSGGSASSSAPPGSSPSFRHDPPSVPAGMDRVTIILTRLAG